MGECNVSKKKTKEIFYATPRWGTEALLKLEYFDGEILEPCCGNGAISKVLEDKGYEVISSDIQIENDIYGDKGKDLYKIEECYDNIVTNPPFNEATEIIEFLHGKYKKKMAMLLKLNFLEAEKRKKLFDLKTLKTIYVFRSRITLYPARQEVKNSKGVIAYAWFVWEKDYYGDPVIKWINEKEPKEIEMPENKPIYRIKK